MMTRIEGLLGRERVISSLDDELQEVAFFLPSWQAAALEAAAHRRGLTAGQMVRRLIREFTHGNE